LDVRQPASSDHFNGQRFFNPSGLNGQPVSAVPKLIATRRSPWPTHIPVAPQRPPGLDGALAVATFIGHASFLIQTAAGNVLTDPVYSQRASPLPFIGPRRVRQPGILFDDLPPISLVLLSHNHYDHCDVATLRAVNARWGSLAVTPLGNGRLLRKAGFRRCEELDWWGEATHGSLRITVTPAQHFSARTPFDRNRALWGGFVLHLGERRVFFAGDSGYGGHFRVIRDRLGPIDLSLLPIGAYEPRWFMRDIHMDPAEAVQAHADLGSTRSVAMHFGTFQLTPEAIDEPLRELQEARRTTGLAEDAFIALEPGDSARVRAR
jgi:L-ascorbate metabolism protein UlaG (beta-lactamase superfamily)